MKVIITGCEYTGASTLARDFVDWLYDKYGGRGKFPPPFSVHDHFEIPDLVHAELNDSERDTMVALAPKLTEAFQRYNVLHHTPTLQSARQPSSGIMVLVGFHLAESIYAQMYYGYGLEGELLDRRTVRPADRQRGDGVRPGNDHGDAHRQPGHDQAADVL